MAIKAAAKQLVVHVHSTVVVLPHMLPVLHRRAPGEELVMQLMLRGMYVCYGCALTRYGLLLSLQPSSTSLCLYQAQSSEWPLADANTANSL